jgi:hypothetical protein
MARMARHVRARELHLHLQDGSGGSGSNNNTGTTASRNATGSVTFPTQRRDLIDASTVKDSLNALPGFKTSAGECILSTSSYFYSFLSVASYLRTKEAERKRGNYPLVRRTTAPGTLLPSKSQTDFRLLPGSSPLADV